MKGMKIPLSMLALTLSSGAVAHGLISEPASRNWLCGAVVKPDQAAAGSICAQAFADDQNGGYQFMSVLTHDVGRAGVSPLPTNVCGFDSETWQGGATPWDKPLDWPTHDFEAGPRTITWDISWGPHFDDTEEFRHWITKPDFQYQVGQPLTWDDFEEEAFCVLTYNDSAPNADPNVVPDKANALFHTTCDIPERSGRHVIYAEWGRNQWTYERFHGCIDASFSGTSLPPLNAAITASPNDNVFAGEGTIQLSAANSVGDNLSYQWSVEAANAALYTLSSTTAANTVLTLNEPQTQSTVTVRLMVTSGNRTDDASFSFTHMPTAGASWADLGALTEAAEALDVGDELQLRLVRENGQDIYLPSTPIVVTAETAAAGVWPYLLAQAVNDADVGVQVGVLNDDGDVEPVQDATSNRVFASVPSDYANAYLYVQAGDNGGTPPVGDGNCEYLITSEWDNGLVGTIRITNDGSQPINDWNVSWSYSDSTTISNSWNANLSGSNPYSATGMGWNNTVQPGQSVEFGFQASKPAGAAAQIPAVTGTGCN